MIKTKCSIMTNNALCINWSKRNYRNRFTRTIIFYFIFLKGNAQYLLVCSRYTAKSTLDFYVFYFRTIRYFAHKKLNFQKIFQFLKDFVDNLKIVRFSSITRAHSYVAVWSNGLLGNIVSSLGFQDAVAGTEC